MPANTFSVIQLSNSRAVSMGDVKADINMVGTVAATVMSKAIENAIKYATISDETYLKNINKNKY